MIIDEDVQEYMNAIGPAKVAEKNRENDAATAHLKGDARDAQRWRLLQAGVLLWWYETGSPKLTSEMRTELERISNAHAL